MNIPYSEEDILNIQSEEEFNKFALLAFSFQFRHNPLYHTFCQSLHRTEAEVKHYTEIPCLPIQFFKSHRILSGVSNTEIVFRSSGTTGEVKSEHWIHDLEWYHHSILAGFVRKFGPPDTYSFLALLPGYIERPDSSLIYMVNYLMSKSTQRLNKFYSSTDDGFWSDVKYNKQNNIPTIIFGVAHSLVTVMPPEIFDLRDFIIIETGGMKGKMKEITREDLHNQIQHRWNVDKIYSEYGMTELLSQAYAVNQNGFDSPPWMKFIIREIHDPLTNVLDFRNGGINVIDLFNIYSCCFIATDDVGKLKSPNTIDILGRLDYSDIRGCNLLFN